MFEFGEKNKNRNSKKGETKWRLEGQRKFNWKDWNRNIHLGIILHQVDVELFCFVMKKEIPNRKNMFSNI